MAEKKSIEVLKTKFAIITYIITTLGAVAQLIALLFPDLSFLNGLVGWFALFLESLIFALRQISVLGVLALVYILLEFFNFFGFERHKAVGLFLGVSIAISFVYVDKYLTLLNNVEEASIDARFRFSAGQIVSKDIKKGISQYISNPKAHKAIQIIGIDNPTLHKYGGWPFSWRNYAKLLAALEGTKANSIMFDIFLVDEVKNNYGLLGLIDDLKGDILSAVNKGRGLSISSGTLKKSKAYLHEQVKRNKNVVMDFSFETGRTSADILNSPEMKERVKIFEKFEIINIEESPYNDRREWVHHPEPPISDIGKALAGMGYANIRKSQTGVNRTLPVVIKWKNRVYPSIDLILAAKFYGVDFKKDVYVKLGEYVKIKNIPKSKTKILIGANPKDSLDDIMAKPNEEREVTIPIDEEGFMAINFIGGPWSFYSQSMQELADSPRGGYATEGPIDTFTNKVLLLSVYYATGAAHDIHLSPFGDMAGIEHHANALNTILTQDFLTYASDWINYLIYIIVGLVLGFVVPRVNMKWVLIGLSGFVVLFIAEVFIAFNIFNYVHIFFSPLIEVVIVMIAITGYKVLTEEENVKYIRSTFSKFVSKDVVNELLASPDALKLGGDKRELTVFFSDIRGFTTISESLSPEDLVHLLNDYLSVMTDIVIEYKGTIDKYMGDAIMAFWGAPLDMEEHAYYACIAALKQLKELDILQEKWKAQGWPPINIGIGLNTGYAVAGNMGSSHRMEYTVMGDTINLGSRLEGTNKVYATRLIISEYTYAKVQEKVIVRELDKIKVKGKNEPVTIYELIDIRNAEDFQKYEKLIH